MNPLRSTLDRCVHALSRTIGMFLLATTSCYSADCLEGNWSGSVGEAKVTLNFNTDMAAEGELIGRYYYRGNWTDLILRRDAGDATQWHKFDPHGTPTGQLTLSCDAATGLSGQWRNPAGDKTLALRAQATKADYDQPRRDASKAKVLQSTTVQGHRVDRISASSAYKSNTLRLQGESAGIAAINTALWNQHRTVLGEAADCAIRGFLRDGAEHEFASDVTQELNEWNARFAVVVSSTWSYCGGDAERWSTFATTYDLQTGSPVTTDDWFAPKFRGEFAADSALVKALRTAYAPDPSEDQRACVEAMPFSSTNIWPTAKGLIFVPWPLGVPRPLLTCDPQTVELPFAKVWPFLSAEGQRVAQAFGAQPPTP